MTLFVGLDVSVKETAVCVVDDTGKVLCEQKVPTEPDDIVRLLASIGEDYGRVGIEAGPLSQWLVNGLTAAGLPVVCVETRHMMALLKAQQINKSDRNGWQMAGSGGNRPFDKAWEGAVSPCDAEHRDRQERAERQPSDHAAPPWSLVSLTDQSPCGGAPVACVLTISPDVRQGPRRLAALVGEAL